MTIVIPATMMPQLTDLLECAPLESAGILFCHEARTPSSTKLLAHYFQPYADVDYLERTADRLVIDPVAVNDRIQYAQRLNLTMIQVHTHPLSNDAEFSERDLAGEREMMPVFFRRVPGRQHGSLVIGRRSWAARTFSLPDDGGFARVLTVGNRIEHLSKLKIDDQERFARSYLALGKTGQAALHETRICVVGLGGLGSHIAQQLAYLGVRNVVMIDPDRIEESNLNRIVGAIASDVGIAKVEVAANWYQRILPGAIIHPISGSILDEDIARWALSCDIVLCCTDNHSSRAVLNWLAYQYLVPMIDLGIEIRLDEASAVDAVGGRIQLVGPDNPCLYCCDSLDANRVREGFLSEEERVRDQYIVGTAVPQPAVISFNGVVASLGTSMLLGITTIVPIASRMQTVNFLTGRVSPAEARIQRDCPICSTASMIFGQGDAAGAIWRKAA